VIAVVRAWRGVLQTEHGVPGDQCGQVYVLCVSVWSGEADWRRSFFRRRR